MDGGGLGRGVGCGAHTTVFTSASLGWQRGPRATLEVMSAMSCGPIPATSELCLESFGEEVGLFHGLFEMNQRHPIAKSRHTPHSGSFVVVV